MTVTTVSEVVEKLKCSYIADKNVSYCNHFRKVGSSKIKYKIATQSHRFTPRSVPMKI